MKICAGKYKGLSLNAPKGSVTRPTSGRLREALFNISQDYIEKCRFLDLFAGSGAMGLEALSRGAEVATFIEKDRFAWEAIEQNIARLKVETQSIVLRGDVFVWLEKLAKRQAQFDVIYADPPYEAIYGKKVVEAVDRLPLLAPGGHLFIEDSKRNLKEEDLYSTLTLVDARNMGRTTLFHYQKS